ncbi:hypothetical protein INT45_003196, partial [Circinella minor]
ITTDDNEEKDLAENNKELRHLISKMDIRILPLLSLCFLLTVIDRSNIGNARIAGLTDTIDITENQYNMALSIFFAGYILFELPSNILLNKIGPRICIACIMIMFGCVLGTMAAVKNGTQLIIARSFLGIAESGLTPAITFYISVWYTESEISKRFAIIYSNGTVAGVLMSIRERQLFFTHRKKDSELLSSSVANKEDENNNHKQILWDSIKLAFKDWHTYAFSILNICAYIPGYSLAFFLPSIILHFGFTPLVTQLMTIAPNLAASIFGIIIAFSVDHHKEIGIHSASTTLISVIGFALLIVLKDHGTYALYISVILATTGLGPINSTFSSWCSCNFSDRTKRSVVIATVNALGNVGGAIAGHIYRESDSPQYIQGHTANLIFVICVVGGCVGLKLAYRHTNHKRDTMSLEERENIIIKNKLNILGDKHPDFRYIT